MSRFLSMSDAAASKGWHASAVLLLSFVYVAVCSVSHTVALRYALQGGLLLLALPLLHHSLPTFRSARYPIILLALFMVSRQWNSG